MSEQLGRRGSGAEGEAASVAGAPAVGKRALVADRYPALGAAMAQRAGGGDAPTIHDAATIAVEQKDGGAPVDGDVSAKVGAHLGADFSATRVHQDPLAQQATAAMGARAFAYGGDVFLGPGESGGDLGLMAHELTHVAQQGAAGQRAPQRAAVQVGDANSPAEAEADQVSAAVTGGGARTASLIVEDGPVQPGQMLRSQFFDQLRTDVTAVCAQELGPEFAGSGVPFVDQTFDRYNRLPAAGAEAMIKRTTPGAQAVRTAAEMIPLVVSRMRAGVQSWRDTGQAPPEFAAVAPAAAAGGGGGAAPSAQALRAPDGAETLASLEADLGPGTTLDGATASRMSGALGADLSAVRIHTGDVASRKAAEAGAVAFAVGDNVVMAASAPAAGTIAGDALLAHELAHTVQQSGASSEPAARMAPIGGESSGAEDHADDAAVDAVAQLHGGSSLAKLASRASTSYKTGLRLQRCETAADRAHTKLVQLNALVGNQVAFRAAVAALTQAETRALLDNISAADRVTYAVLIRQITSERAVAQAEALDGHLTWPAPSGPDATGQIDQTVNDFAIWVRGGPDPTNASRMNCWEMVLYSAWRSGAVTKAWVVGIHNNAAAAYTAAGGGAGAKINAYYAVLEAAMGVGAAAPWAGGVIPRGHLVFFGGLEHVAISTGVVTGAGQHEIMSLWTLPPVPGDTTQRTTVEVMAAQILGAFGAASAVTHGPPPW